MKAAALRIVRREAVDLYSQFWRRRKLVVPIARGVKRELDGIRNL